jgi:hypothetical protein
MTWTRLLKRKSHFKLVNCPNRLQILTFLWFWQTRKTFCRLSSH